MLSVHFVLIQNEPKNQGDFEEIFVVKPQNRYRSYRFMLFFAQAKRTSA